MFEFITALSVILSFLCMTWAWLIDRGAGERAIQIMILQAENKKLKSEIELLKQ